ncbi:Hsp70 family protein [Microbacterium mangrovi]|uniref:Hsp70 family protein n=1 Tax=Microbacterium mangrovi TaxID=1348253 RepID=UPI00068CD89A|nr:Hsp70 family protein [Microbacterium mangrovi]
MRLGIDFGTTRTVVAGVDRGVHPVLEFEDHAGGAHGFFPTVVALAAGRLVFGFEALEAGRRGAPVLRSFTHLLGDPVLQADSTASVGSREVPLVDLLAAYLRDVRDRLPVDPGEVAVSVPAHAPDTRRHLTLEAFRAADFAVVATIDEPSAAAFEYTHRHARSLTARRSQIGVFDLGGDTFDASLLDARGGQPAVLETRRVPRLGSDDFDRILVDLVLARVGAWREALEPAVLENLEGQCRAALERLTPQTRRIAVDVHGDQVVVPVDELWAAIGPLVERCLAEMDPLVGVLDRDSSVAGISLVGSGSRLPLVSRLARERYGSRVHRSPHPSAATAIGLAISIDR